MYRIGDLVKVKMKWTRILKLPPALCIIVGVAPDGAWTVLNMSTGRLTCAHPLDIEVLSAA